MKNHFYCPYCGTTQLGTNKTCVKCHSNTDMLESQLNGEYYRQKSLKKYNDYTHWYEFLLPEIKANPLFDEEKFNAKTIPNPNEKNQPKCPTCGSTNIKKISDLSRGVHALAFGIFSNTARSQFECQDCHYKW